MDYAGRTPVQELWPLFGVFGGKRRGGKQGGPSAAASFSSALTHYPPTHFYGGVSSGLTFLLSVIKNILLPLQLLCFCLFRMQSRKGQLLITLIPIGKEPVQML